MLDNCHQLHFMLLLRKRMQEPRAILLGAIANGSQGSENILTLQKCLRSLTDFPTASSVAEESLLGE